MDYLAIVGIVLVVVGGIWSGWALLKHIPRDIAEFLVIVASAIEDDNITREELRQIVEAGRNIVLKVNKIIGR